MSPMRGISTVGNQEEPVKQKQTTVEDPEPVQEPPPEYHPTPKKDKDKEYQEYRKEVELAKATGAIKKYKIPKRNNEENSGASTEVYSSRDNSRERKEESPKDPRTPREERNS